MKLSHLLLSLAFLVAACHCAEELRLIQFSETKKEWLSVSAVEKLSTQKGTGEDECGHFMDITDYQYQDTYAPFDAIPIPSAPRFQQYVEKLLPSAEVENVRRTITSMGDFYTRYYTTQTGIDSAKWLLHEYALIAEKRPDIIVKNFTYTAFPQASVIATIPGQGPNKDTIVVLGGHLDSVGSTATGRAPGADDDASGSATVLEVFRVLVAAGHVPDFTLQFMGYAAEEVGLRGSQGIALDYQSKNIQVYAALQLDMTGYSSTGTPSTGIVTDFTSSELNAFVRKLVSTYTSLRQSDKTCGYACSDHASWNRTGVRSSFPFETVSNPRIHTANDVIANLNTQQLEQFIFLGVSFAVELGGVASS